MPMDLAIRRREPEWMDQPDIDAASHRAALRGLRRVNRFSRPGPLLWRAVSRVARTCPTSPLRILDVACGGGDVTLQVARLALRARVEVHVAGIDRSPVAVEYAGRQAAAAGLSNVVFRVGDALAGLGDEPFDVVMCSLFLHHLADKEVVRLLRDMAATARRLVLASDLRRTRSGYWLAWWGCRLLSRSRIVHNDGPVSVAAAFLPHEIQHLAEQAGLRGARVDCCWPQRLLLTWSPP